jgi:hypothetical protein
MLLMLYLTIYSILRFWGGSDGLGYVYQLVRCDNYLKSCRLWALPTKLVDAGSVRHFQVFKDYPSASTRLGLSSVLLKRHLRCCS